jgi:hypothetical protein
VHRPHSALGLPARGSHGWLARVVTGLLGGLLLVVAAVSTVHESRVAARGALDHSLEDQAVARAIALQEHFERSASLSLLLANDSALKAYAGANRVAPGRPAPAQMSATASQALAYLQHLHPGRITAASLMDRYGTEHAKAVDGVATPTGRLSYSRTLAGSSRRRWH